MPSKEDLTKVDRPIFICGNSRSGTWMMHRVLSRHPQVAMHPLEQKWVWKYGHYDSVSDRLVPEQLTDKIAKHIRRKFAKYQRQAGPGRRVGEKTNCNVMRIACIHSIFPDAKIIHMVRDGRASAYSSAEYWVKPFEPQYGKIFQVPLWQKIRMVSAYFYRKLKKLFVRNRAVAPWGVCFDGIKQAMKEYSLLEVCGIQWRESVETGHREGTKLGPANYYECRYEEFCHRPNEVLAELLKFLELPGSQELEAYVEANVHTKAVDRWRGEITEEELELLSKHIAPALKEFGCTE